MSTQVNKDSSFSEKLAHLQNFDFGIKANAEVNIVNARGGTDTYKYATLDVIKKAITPELARLSLFIVQLVGENCSVKTILRDLFNDVEIQSTASFPIGDRARIQSYGEAITYLRRYSIVTLLGLTIDDDNDGGEEPVKKTSKKKDWTDSDIEEMKMETVRRLLDRHDFTTVETFLKNNILSDVARKNIALMINEKKASLTKKSTGI